jgi:hypothetical protein
MPAMADPHFAHAADLRLRAQQGRCAHRQQADRHDVVGAVQQIDVPLADDVLRVAPVRFGGPVKSTAALCCTVRLATGNPRWRSRRPGVTTSKDVLEGSAAAMTKDVFVSLDMRGRRPADRTGAERMAHRAGGRRRCSTCRRAALPPRCNCSASIFALSEDVGHA